MVNFAVFIVDGREDLIILVAHRLPFRPLRAGLSLKLAALFAVQRTPDFHLFCGGDGVHTGREMPGAVPAVTCGSVRGIEQINARQLAADFAGTLRGHIHLTTT